MPELLVLSLDLMPRSPLYCVIVLNSHFMASILRPTAAVNGGGRRARAEGQTARQSDGQTRDRLTSLPSLSLSIVGGAHQSQSEARAASDPNFVATLQI